MQFILLPFLHMWGHPHVTPSPIQSRFTSQLSFLCPYTNQHTDPAKSILTTTGNHSPTTSFSVYLLGVVPIPRGCLPWEAELHPTSHAYQLYQPASGRADWTAGNLYKRRPSNQREAVRSRLCDGVVVVIDFD